MPTTKTINRDGNEDNNDESGHSDYKNVNNDVNDDNDDENSHANYKNNTWRCQLLLQYHQQRQQRRPWQLNRQRLQKCDKNDDYEENDNVKDDCIRDSDDNQDANDDTHFNAVNYSNYKPTKKRKNRKKKEKASFTIGRQRRFAKRQATRKTDLQDYIILSCRPFFAHSGKRQ